MAINNKVTLIGNLGSEANIINIENTTFAAVSLATTDTYRDKNGEWQNRETIWHQIRAFNPQLVEMLKGLHKGDRLEITGSLSYLPFKVMDDNGKTFTKHEASIIAYKIAHAPLSKKPIPS